MSLTGSDTSAINQYRQGVNAFGTFNRRSSLPILAPESNTAVMTTIVFGQPKTFNTTNAFEDLSKFNPVNFINDESGEQSFPSFFGNVNLRDPDQMNGVIEPFGIRAKASLTSIDFPYESHDIRGVFMVGNIDRNLAVEQVFQSYPIDRAKIIVPFIDSDEYMGSGSMLSVRLPGIFSDDKSIIHPFEDQDAGEGSKLGILISGSGIIGALEEMNPATEDILANDHRSAGAGFTYTNNAAGTDSIAFGGLKK